MRGRSLTFALVLAAVIAGCGSSNAARNPTSIGPINAQVFRASLNGVCHQAQRVLGRVSERKAVTLYERYVHEFEALAPPPGQRAVYSKFVRSLHRAFTEFRAGHSARPATASAQLLAIQLGVQGCGQIMPELGGY